MAVAVDQIGTTATTVGAATTLDNTTLTVGVGANRVLYVVLSTETSASAPTMKWDALGSNQTVTLLASLADTNAASKLWVFGLVAPTSGNKTLRATWTGAADATLAGACFTGADQTGGATTFITNTATGANAAAASNSVTSAVGNYTMAAWSAGGATNFGTFNQTQWYLSGTALSYVSAGASATGAASVSYTTGAGPAASPYAFAGVNIVAAAGAAAKVPYTPVRQLGPVQAQ